MLLVHAVPSRMSRHLLCLAHATLAKAVLILTVSATLAACHPKVSVNVGLGQNRQLHEARVLPGGGSDKVAIIELRGTIIDSPQSGLFGPGPNPVDQFVAALTLAEKDPRVKAVIIRINSPGGSVTASDTLYSEITRFREQTHKPVIASMGEIAASGGYYTALAADTIIAQPTTITGSIGVIFPTINIHEALTSIGVSAHAYTSGENKDLANPLTPPRQSHAQIIQATVDEYFAKFKALVIEHRPALANENVDMATDGRVFSGDAALALGLVDRVGTLRDAFSAAKLAANAPNAQLVKYVAEGLPVQSPYAGASASPGTGVPLLDLPHAIGLPDLAKPMAYYLWTPGW